MYLVLQQVSLVLAYIQGNWSVKKLRIKHAKTENQRCAVEKCITYKGGVRFVVFHFCPPKFVIISVSNRFELEEARVARPVLNLQVRRLQSCVEAKVQR